MSLLLALFRLDKWLSHKPIGIEWSACLSCPAILSVWYLRWDPVSFSLNHTNNCIISWCQDRTFRLHYIWMSSRLKSLPQALIPWAKVSRHNSNCISRGMLPLECSLVILTYLPPHLTYTESVSHSLLACQIPVANVSYLTGNFRCRFKSNFV